MLLNLLVLLSCHMTGSVSGDRDSDIFSSTYELSTLAKKEQVLVEDMKRYRDMLTGAIDKLTNIENLIEIQKRSEGPVCQPPNYEYNGDINMEKLCGDVSSDESVVVIAAETVGMAEEMFETESKLRTVLAGLPQMDQMVGAGNGVFLLQEAYNLNVTEIAEGKIRIKTEEDWRKDDFYTGFHKLTSDDVEFIAKIAYNRGFYDRAVQWFSAALSIAESKERRVKLQNLLMTTKNAHDQVLDRKGWKGSSNGNTWRTLRLPFNKKLREKKKFKKIKKELEKPEETITDREKLDSEAKESFLWNEFNRLCREAPLGPQSSQERCGYLHYFDPYLRLAPFKQDIQHRNPFITVFRDFFSNSEMEYYITYAKSKLFRSQVSKRQPLTGHGGTDQKRTSKQAWLYEYEFPEEKNQHRGIGPYFKRDEMVHLDTVAHTVSKRISLATGLFASELAGGEAYQIANYGLGGVYNHHPDPSDLHNPSRSQPVPEHEKPLRDVSGDRLATVMGYLTQVELGGGTAFPEIGVSIVPEKGSAVFWWNLSSVGYTDFETVHGGCPVLVGSKWITNKWIRWTAQNLVCPCNASSPHSRQLELANTNNRRRAEFSDEVYLPVEEYYNSLANFSPEFT